MAGEFRLAQMPDSSVLMMYSMRSTIQTYPTYQRMSGVWNESKRQLLIDSLLNGFDIPKLYFHEFMPLKKIGQTDYRYAIIDGKQRLETIWGFIDGAFALAKDFEFYRDEKVKAGEMTYRDLSKKYPKLKILFDSRTLPIMTIQTEDLELIEEMFSRLNEAVPLNAAEKRNAWPGPLPAVIRKVAKHRFFTRSLPFANMRYKHFDIATKFLLIENNGEITDTKKEYLDEFVRSFEKAKSVPDDLRPKCTEVLTSMRKMFTIKDSLLRSIGMVTVYYTVFRQAIREGWRDRLDRAMFQEFEVVREENRKQAEKELTKADYDLLEFDRLSQSPNDAVAIRFRHQIMVSFLKGQIKRGK